MIQSFANGSIRKNCFFEKNRFQPINSFSSNIQKKNESTVIANDLLENDSNENDSIVCERIDKKPIFFEKLQLTRLFDQSVCSVQTINEINELVTHK